MKPAGKILFAACILYLVYATLGTVVKEFLLKNNGRCTTAVLINEAPGTIHRYSSFNLLYKFTNEGKMYKGNSTETDTSKIGESICVVYLPSFPSINRPLKYFGSGKIKCDCNK